MPRSPLRRWGLAVVRGRSMLPALRDGDRLLVQHGAVPRVGGLAVVRLPAAGGTPVIAVKRVSLREPGGWFVTSDNALEGVTAWVGEADVVAVVRARLWPPRGVRRRAHP